jgi:formate C-acetyltransferase
MDGAPLACGEVWSPQEIRLREARAGLAERLAAQRPRVFAIWESFRGLRPRIDVARARLFTASMRATEGEPLVLRWAKALYHIAAEIPVHIDPGQLLAGRCGRPGRYGILYPELDGDFLDLAVTELSARPQSPFDIAAEDARVVVEEIAPFWKGRTFHEALAAALPAETLRFTYDPGNPLASRFIVNETASFRSCLQWVHDYEKVLARGFAGLRAEAEARRAALDPLSPRDQAERRPFYDAVVLVCEAIVLWARRHADKAAALAAAEPDPVRRAELAEIARICRRVPEHPAETFHEALQAQWFTQMFSRLEQKTGTIISNGRMDQYLYPFYRRDLEAGAIDSGRAIELLECMWLGMAQFIDLYISPVGGAFNEGYAHWEAVTIGGQTPDGRDATNPLTELFLRSKREFPLSYPDLAARVHARSPERYLWEVAETIKEGSGFPKLINDEEVVPLYVAKGARFDEALDYAVSGCSEARMPNRDTFTSGCAYINFAAALEMTLLNGRTRRTGAEQIGPATGDPRGFATWEEFFNAYLAQQTEFIRQAFIQQLHVNRLRARHFAAPLASALHALCMESAVDLHQEKIPGGIDLGYFEFIGYATVVDSLAAVKRLVYDERRVGMAELLAALEDDFAGREDLRQTLLNAPRYGNNDPAADAIGKAVDRAALEFTRRYAPELGVHLDLRYVPFTSHVPFGKVVGATPNGRKAGTPLSDGASASQGADRNGPTAVLLSNFATKNPDFRERASRLLNLKLTPSCVAGEAGTRRLIALIRTWCDLKLWHLQFNVINPETLLAAQRDPESYRGLIVRIAGYSAYFVELTADLQNDLIARTAHTGMG